MNRYSHRKSRNAGSGWLLTTHVMQLSLMIEPVEVDNLQITVSQGIKSPYLLMIETVEVLITCIPRRMVTMTINVM